MKAEWPSTYTITVPITVNVPVNLAINAQTGERTRIGTDVKVELNATVPTHEELVTIVVQHLRAAADEMESGLTAGATS